MTTELPEDLLHGLSAFVAAKTGLHFPPRRWKELERGLGAVAKEFGCADPASCARGLLAGTLTPHQLEVVASHLTVGETYFFREPRSFEILEGQILPELVRGRFEREPGLRVWSAACCTGEEAYSLAIALRRAAPSLGERRATVLGTDINARFLRQAARGVYGAWSFRDAPPWLRGQYFTSAPGGKHRILEPIRSRVTFNYLNLVEDVYPSLLNGTNAMDVIFCRNVLMYFAPERAREVLEKLGRCLVEGGWLVVGASEVSQVTVEDLEPVSFSGLTIYRKAGRSTSGTGRRRVVTAGVGLGQPNRYAATAGEHWSGEQAEKDEAQLPAKDVASVSEPAPVTARAGGWRAAEPPVTPASEDQWYAEAAALHDLGEYEAAVGRLRLILERAPTCLHAMTLLARALANRGQLAEARTWVEKAIGADKLQAEVHYLRASILQEQGEDEDAAAALKRAVYLDPKMVLAHFALGALARRCGRAEEAQRHFANTLDALRDYPAEEILPASDGLIAARLRESVATMLEAGVT